MLLLTSIAQVLSNMTTNVKFVSVY